MNGPTIADNGDIISAALKVDAPSAHKQIFNDTRMVLGQIQHIYAVDDIQNTYPNPGTFTLYDVQIFHADSSTEVIKRVRAVQPLFGGGYNNFFEVLPTDPGQKATDFSVTPPYKPGSWVLIGFIDGQRQNGVILGTMPHPNPVAVADRPSKSDGVKLAGEFQGLNFQIQNDGSLVITFNGPRDDTGRLVNQNGPTVFKIDATGNMSMTTNNKQSIVVDRVNGIIDVVNGTTEIKMEQSTSTITTTSDFLVSNVNKDATVNVGGEAKVIAKGDMTLSSNTMIKLQRGPDSTPAEPFVLGAQFVSFMSAFLQAVIEHTHIGNLGFDTDVSENVNAFIQLKASPIDDKKIQSKLIIGDN